MIKVETRIDEKTLKAILYPQIREETKIFSSFHQILAKIETDGHLKSIYQLFDYIFDSEKQFAIQRFLKRNK
jgi:hypothetical protein